MEIKLALSPSERLAVYQFRYSVIVEELGVMIPAANHAEKLVRDGDDDHGHLFCGSIAGKVVATARMNLLRDGLVFPHADVLSLANLPASESVSVCSRFLVAKERRGSVLAVRMMQDMYRFMRESGIAFDFILVSRDLVSLYERVGYRPYGPSVEHPEIGVTVPLRLSVGDEGHLRSIRSPLVQCLPSLRQKDFGETQRHGPTLDRMPETEVF